MVSRAGRAPEAMRWLQLVKRDPVPWLLDPANPSARYLTLRRIFKKPSAALEQEQARILAWKPVAEIRSHWSRFSFWGRALDPYFGGMLGNFGTLALLQQLGVPTFPEVEPTCESLLELGRHEDGRFAPAGGGRAPWLCYTGMALQLLFHFGYVHDPRVNLTWEWLVDVILDDSELLVCSLLGDRCRDGLVKVLGALLQRPPAARTADDLQAIDTLSRKLLDYPYDFQGKDAGWLELSFPRYYNSDLAELCSLLAQTSCRELYRFRELLYPLLVQQDNEGRWIKQRATPMLTVERIFHPSRWLTLEVAQALTLTYGDDVYAP